MADIEVIEVGFQGPPGTVSPEDRARIDAAIAAARALDTTAAQLLAARDQALAGVRQITGLSAVAGDATVYDPATGVLTVQRGPVGPAPAHRWTNTALAFQNADGTMGAAVDLKGTPGKNGAGFTGGAYNATSGKVTFTSVDGLGFSTEDLRGAPGKDGIGVKGDPGTSWTVTVVTTQSAYDAATPAANQLVVLV